MKKLNMNTQMYVLHQSRVTNRSKKRGGKRKSVNITAQKKLSVDRICFSLLALRLLQKPKPRFARLWHF